jgi:membrane protease subunit (stomatin/prohibitin family)
MKSNDSLFLEILEWFDDGGDEIVHRIPESGSADIKYGAQLIVRESQAAVFFYNGKAYDAFGPGRHTLTTANIPILTRILSLPWGLTSPLRAEVCFVNLKNFTNFKWGTRDPVAFKDSQLGLVRLRAFGVFNITVAQPVLLINKLVGTQGVYTKENLEDYLSQVIVSRLNDLLGDQLDSLINLPGRYESIADGLQERLAGDCADYGLALSALFINSITPPLDVQKAIDDKSRLGLFDDLDSLVKMKTAMAMEKAAASGSSAGAGIGMGLGLLVPSLAERSKEATAHPDHADAACPWCSQVVPQGARFCPTCGHTLLVHDRCVACGADLPPHARFCSACGKPADHKEPARVCSRCGFENLPGSAFCNQCGEKLA